MTKEALLKTLEASREALLQYQKEQEASMKQSKEKGATEKNEHDRDVVEAVEQLQGSAHYIYPPGRRCPRCNGSGRA